MNIEEYIRNVIEDKDLQITKIFDKSKMKNYKTLYNRLNSSNLKADDLLRLAGVMGLDLNEMKIKHCSDLGIEI